MSDSRITTLAAHPRAGAAIRRWKAVGGLGAFALAALFGYQHGLPFFTLLERGLVAGIAGQLVAWAAAVTVWKRLLVAQALASRPRPATEAPEAAE
jgi:uncharacterized membrane protein YccC